MPRRVPLPPELSGRAFTVADAADAGLTRGRLRSADLVSPFHGVREPAAQNSVVRQRPAFSGNSVPDVALLDRCHAYATRLKPGEYFSHLTAARLWGVPLPTPFTPGEPLHVSCFAPQRPPRTRGVVGHQLPQRADAVIHRFGLPVADAATAWVQLASVLPPAELVVAGDHLVLDPYVLDPGDPRPFVGIEELAERLASFRGRGKRAATRSLSRVRAGAESRPETLLRLLLVDAGLPEPLLNQALYDASGRFLGRVDLVYPEQRVVVEYDGDQHRTSTAQYERDQTRLDALRHAGWLVVQVRRHGLFVRPEATVARVRTALFNAARRP
ncbi:endonuclease domain-containing protein [Kitasatospora indigofera]|uniref:endonuclease domain-containing protein n=1 Tax=Kitasatospora indigofera TaxID=67307 RepID=UPI003690B266